MFTYVVFAATGEMTPASSVDDAKRMIRERYPTAHFGEWFTAEKARQMPAWARPADEVLFDLGETHDTNRPIGYVRTQNWQIKFGEDGKPT